MLKMPKDWDIDSYKKEHENIEHWELRKKFMLTHKDKFPEDELVCLANVFTNIEFLGCRYPDQTMKRVAELAKGVVEKFHEQRKNSLKRTFVSASSAVSAKLKGQTPKGLECGPPAKKAFILNKSEEKSDFPKVTTKNDELQKFKGYTQTSEMISQSARKVAMNKRYKKQLELIPCNISSDNFVIIFSEKENTLATLQRSASLNKVNLRWDFEENEGGMKVCKLYFAEQLMSSSVGESKKVCKERAASAAIEKLRESCFAIKEKKFKFTSGSVVGIRQINSTSDNTVDEKLGDDNIGSKLMKLMGWKGCGLGSKEQGIIEPVVFSGFQLQRSGLGYSNNEENHTQFKNEVTKHIKNWMKGDTNKDLVFSSEFSLIERKIIHEVCRHLSLRSKSYGKSEGRHIVVSKKSSIWAIVEELIKAGGSSEKYDLFYPTKRS